MVGEDFTMNYGQSSSSTTPTISERDAEFAVNHLTELADNLFAATHVTNIFGMAGVRKELTLVELAPFFRMTFCWIIISLWKVVELWGRFGLLASDEHKVEMRALAKDIRARGVEGVRNKIAAHMLDRETKEPVMPEEIQELIVKVVMKNDMRAFFRWLVLFEEPTAPDTVAGKLLHFRADILKAFPNVRITA
jgi:hypothetical protein